MMGINGKWEAVVVPRWLMVVAAFVLLLLSAGWAGATYFNRGDREVERVAQRIEVVETGIKNAALAIDSLRVMARDVRDIKTLICRDHPGDSACPPARSR